MSGLPTEGIFPLKTQIRGFQNVWGRRGNLKRGQIWGYLGEIYFLSDRHDIFFKKMFNDKCSNKIHRQHTLLKLIIFGNQTTF